MFASKAKEVLNAAANFSSRRKNQLLADLIHMHLNRLFIDRQRHQELIVYYCIYKYQVSIAAMAKKSN